MIQDVEYWKNRRSSDPYNDWRTNNGNWILEYWESSSHPHRDQIVGALSGVEWNSLLEIGCNCGPNINRIRQEYGKDKMYVGIDPNKDAINYGRNMMPDVAFIEGGVENIDINGMKFDIVLLDAVLMYVKASDIKDVAYKIGEMANKMIIICDWYDKNKYGIIKDGHWARDYSKLFNKWKCETKQIKWPTSEKWIRNGRIFIFRPV